MAANISQGDLIKKSWEMVKGDLVFFIVGFLVTFLVGYITLGILMGPLMVGFVMAIFKKMNGETVGIGDIFSLGMSKFVPGLVAMLVLGLGIMIGSIVIIGGIVVGIFGAFTFQYIADKDLDGIAAIKASFGLVKANFGTAFVTLLVAGLIGGLGTVACYVGVFVTGPMALIMITLAYKELTATAA